MRLAKLTGNEPTERSALTMKVSTYDLLRKYQEAYKAFHESEIGMNPMIEALLLKVIEQDTDFMKTLAATKVGAKPVPAKGK
jgi:hypothetical protein